MPSRTHHRERLVSLMLAGLALTACNQSAVTRDPLATPARPVAATKATGSEDLQVNLRVMAALEKDAEYNTLDIQVLTLNGQVRLIGLMETQLQIDDAIQLARGVQGVRGVQDELRVR